jgi:hypothetical protein
MAAGFSTPLFQKLRRLAGKAVSSRKSGVKFVRFSYNVRRPFTKLIISMTSATTSRIWINPLKVYELTKPSSHKTRRITAIVVSIIYLSSLLFAFDPPAICYGSI